jgi:hypothetical protein
MDDLKPIELAEQVARVAAELGISTALIGAAAMAVHGYLRATAAIDLGVSVTDPSGQLGELEARLTAAGLQCRLLLPDHDDALGGVLRVWQEVDEDGDPVDFVEVINFFNPHRPGRPNPFREAATRATPVGERAFRVVTLPDLILLKLSGGSRRDLADVVDLLFVNSDADVDTIRALCGRFGHAELIDTLIAEARAR